jgi:hypothetical protein
MAPSMRPSSRCSRQSTDARGPITQIRTPPRTCALHVLYATSCSGRCVGDNFIQERSVCRISCLVLALGIAIAACQDEGLIQPVDEPIARVPPRILEAAAGRIVLLQDDFNRADSPDVGSPWMEENEGSTETCCTESGLLMLPGYTEIREGALTFHYEIPANPPSPFSRSFYSPLVHIPLAQPLEEFPVEISFTLSPHQDERVYHEVGLLASADGFEQAPDPNRRLRIPKTSLAIVMAHCCQASTGYSTITILKREASQTTVLAEGNVYPFQFGQTYTVRVTIQADFSVSAEVTYGQFSPLVVSSPSTQFTATLDRFYIDDVQGGISYGSNASGDYLLRIDDLLVTAPETDQPQCSDGVDNDGDGKIDYPADGGCASAGDTSEIGSAQCSDGVDNDGDGKVDFPADGGCTSATDNNELNRQCSDGIDNDGDGKVDYPADGGCTSATDNNEIDPQCVDGIDNDGDGQVDYPADGGCTSAVDNNESGPPQCSDGLDNDSDGQVDYPADPGCTGAGDNNEINPSAATRSTMEVAAGSTARPVLDCVGPDTRSEGRVRASSAFLTSRIVPPQEGDRWREPLHHQGPIRPRGADSLRGDRFPMREGRECGKRTAPPWGGRFAQGVSSPAMGWERGEGEDRPPLEPDVTHREAAFKSPGYPSAKASYRVPPPPYRRLVAKLSLATAPWQG